MKMKYCYSLLQTAKPIRNVISIRNASIKLPKYPVPALYETLEKYLKSVKPFLSPDELRQTANTVKDFGEPGGIGEELQHLLHKKAEKENNWLVNWWLNTAYLEFRKPVVVHSNPGLVFPKQKFRDERERLTYAAKMTAAALDYKDQIDKEKIPQDMRGADPLDMAQYKKIFGTCRLPFKPRDKLVFHPKSSHIVVAYKNNFYEVCVSKDNQWMKYDQILKLLEDIIDRDDPEGPPIGILTSDCRDMWSEAYKELIESHHTEALNSIEEALFLLCLDANCPEYCRNDQTTAGIQMVHGGGPNGNAANRWFDKTIQFVVSADGSNGLTYEHSPAEGGPLAVLMDYIVIYIQNAPSGGEAKLEKLPKLLNFCPNSKLDGYISTAKEHLLELVSDVEFNCFNFDRFGKSTIQKHKLSPDSFLQMAMQYAFYKIHKKPGAHYESACARKFIDGRTETIRSCSEESIRFAKAMCDNSLSAQSKANALRLAISAHRNYTAQAINARGVDRHLLGLKLIALECRKPMHGIYSDIAFSRSSHMRISTSQVASQCDGFMVYGPLVQDGYACCYNPRKTDINFGTSAYRSCEETDLDKFQACLESALIEMDDVLTKAPVARL